MDLHSSKEQCYPSDAESMPENRLFAQFHSPQTNAMNSQHQAKLRVVFATVALGMGVDIPCIRHVIHVGLPHTVRELKSIRMLKQLKKRIIRRCRRWVNPGRTERWWQNLWSG